MKRTEQRRFGELAPGEDPAGIGLRIRAAKACESTSPLHAELLRRRVGYQIAMGRARGRFKNGRVLTVGLLCFASGIGLAETVSFRPAQNSSAHMQPARSEPPVVRYAPYISIAARLPNPVSKPDATTALRHRPRSAYPIPGTEAVKLVNAATQLEEAFRALRIERDGERALTLLCEAERLDANGEYADEIEGARVAALRAATRPEEALGLLELAVKNGGRRTEEREVMLGELLAEAGNCHRAVTVLTPLLERTTGILHERALFSAAVCESRLGNRPHSSTMFRAYLEQHPTGRFVSQARAVLGWKDSHE